MDIATTTNNPGNLKWASWMRKLGGQPSGIPGQDGGQFAAFPDPGTGLMAYKAQLFGTTDGIRQSKIYTPNTTVDSALKAYSNNGYTGDIYPEIKNKKLGELTEKERAELTKRQLRHESSSMYKSLVQQGVFS